MKESTVYLAGGCYWGVQRYMDVIKGVIRTEVGFANGFVEAPSYEQVKHTETGHAETVKVVYDRDLLPLPVLLALFYRIIDPCSVDRQGGDVGHQYRTGVYWSDPADEGPIKESLKKLAEKVGQPLAVEAMPLSCFYPAEEYHQKYLVKNPSGYCHVNLQMIREAAQADIPALARENT